VKSHYGSDLFSNELRVYYYIFQLHDLFRKINVLYTLYIVDMVASGLELRWNHILLCSRFGKPSQCYFICRYEVLGCASLVLVDTMAKSHNGICVSLMSAPQTDLFWQFSTWYISRDATKCAWCCLNTKRRGIYRTERRSVISHYDQVLHDYKLLWRYDVYGRLGREYHMW